MYAIIRTAVISLVCFIIASVVYAEDTSLAGRRLLVMENESSYFAIDLAGGTTADFHLKDQGMNPFTWNHPEKGDTDPRPMGHFICFDRWGAPTEAEQNNGMPYHGEASKVNWAVEQQPAARDGKIAARIKCQLPIAQLQMVRTILLDDTEPVVEIIENITNIGKLGRIYNLIQHGSFAAPFLSKETIISTDVARGFYQNGPSPGEPVIYWPEIAYEGKFVDLSRMDGEQGPGVLSFIFPDEFTLGWITAANPEKGLVVGYVWDIDDYPWLNMWRNFNENGPAAFGIEFGTSGLHQPYPQLIKQHEIFGRQLYEYVDADETITKSYTLYLENIPHDFTGVGELTEDGGVITMKEKDGGNQHTITIDMR